MILWRFISCVAILSLFDDFYGVRSEDECPVLIFTNDNETFSEVFKSTNKLEEIWVNFNANFMKFVFKVRMKADDDTPSYMFEEELNVSKEEINPPDESWLLMIVNIVTRKRTFNKDTILVRVTINRRSYELDTDLWWRYNEVEQFYVYVQGGLQIALGCDPQQQKTNPNVQETDQQLPETDQKLQETDQQLQEIEPTDESATSLSTTSSIFVISFPIILMLLVIAIGVIIYLRRKQKKRRIAIENQKVEDGIYETLDEMVLEKNNQFSPPIPPLPTYLTKNSRKPTPENHYSIPVKLDKVSSPIVDTFIYDVPKAPDVVTSSPLVEENQYMIMKNDN